MQDLYKKFCTYCGGKLDFKIPDFDNRKRYICSVCKTIDYQNPKIIVGTLPIWKNDVLLCQRAIEPQIGLWTCPCGFLENGETVEAGAIRETAEECNANISIIKLITIFSIPKINQVYLIFLATLNNPSFSVTMESSHVKLFKVAEIPWKDIAFESITFALETYINNKDSYVRIGSQETV